jgi:hypothetical protein
MILQAIDTFETLLINKGNIKEVYFTEHLAWWSRINPMLKRARRLSKFINMDNIYF